MGYSKAPEQPQSSAKPMCHSHAMTRTGREPATIRIAALELATLCTAPRDDNYSTVGGDGGCRVGEVRAGTTSPMPDHKGFKLYSNHHRSTHSAFIKIQKFSTLMEACIMFKRYPVH